MTETANIAEIAAKVSKELFGTFLWETHGPIDQEWPCEEPENHRPTRRRRGANRGSSDDSENDRADEAEGQSVPVVKHPTDIVFYYDEPYSNHRTYINCDLKSYAARSIKKSEVKKAIESLARALACLEKSSTWRNRYVRDDKNALYAGMLFVYNHDGDYNTAFDELLATINLSSFDIPPNSKIIVLGPREISWLDNVSNEMLRMVTLGQLGQKETWRFFYPTLVLAKNVQPSARAAIAEMLTGPWIVLKHRISGAEKDSVLVFYRGAGETMEEFSLLIDYLMFHGLVEEGVRILIRALQKESEARALFEKAADDYIHRFEGGDELSTLLKGIHYQSMAIVRRSYSTTEIGMERGE
jgi:hypothetical protein